jgi:SpoVK/Ycf46/Vps4 family AAA+-type ATPase
VSASADHIKALVRSHTSGDDEGFYAVALQVAANAARQGHHRLAGDLKQLVDTARRRESGTVVTAIAQPRGELADLVVASFPKVRLRDLVVPDELRTRLEHVITEQRQRHALMERGFNPTHRILLEGPPGTGKTMTAAVLAHELGLPLLTIRLDSVLSKYLGETGSKLRVLFDAVATQRAVYLFDEFDALGGDRAGNDVGEARRILNSFLVFLENASAESLVISSTNHRAILDPALFRRFDMVISYDRPDQHQAVAVMKARLGPLGKGVRWSTVRTHAEGLSHAELVKAAETAAKRALLAQQTVVTTQGLVAALEERHMTNRA